jgi:ubiquinone/menaquinone biosynthesis C-methylase UbiE
MSGANMQMPSYHCPDCRVPLQRFYCTRCRFEFPSVDGVPSLLSRNPRFGRTGVIAADYDSIYTARSRVWENQGRTPEFIRYFSSLLDRYPGGRSLEIGCGEGYLLAARSQGEKFAVDLSIEAIRRARTRARADFSLALAERLPFPAEHFDLVTSVGVMEHFLDTGEALREIRRVLKPGGHYVNLVHVELTFGERLGWIVSRFLFPRPRPVQFCRWASRQLVSRMLPDRQEFPAQPIQNRFTTLGGKAWLARSGFNVLEIVHRRRYPDLPLIGPSVVIYVARK